MSRGVIAATQADAEGLAANEFRGEVILHHISGDQTFIAFGETAVVAEGLSLVATTRNKLRITGPRAALSFRFICAGGESAVIGYDAI